MQRQAQHSNPLIAAVRRVGGLLHWTRHSTYLMGAFTLVVGLILYFWWPLALDYLRQADWSGKWWIKVDWLLIGVFAVMSLLLMAGANLKYDLPIVFVATLGGLVIESWGTQTLLWTYYTAERPPLWIIPAWPVATLAIDRIVRILQRAVPERFDAKAFRWLYWPMFAAFSALLLMFVWPTRGKSLTVVSIILVALLIATPKDYRAASLTFIAGSGLGYFLELWGTTRLCWTYYTLQQPPLFAVLAHGMAALAFWRVLLLLKWLVPAALSQFERLIGWRAQEEAA